MEKSYKYRIYPNKKQKELLAKTFGCCRYVYNHYLAKRIEKYEEDKLTFNYYDCCKDLTQLKKEHDWLKEADSTALQSSLRDLDMAYQKFFKEHTGYPKFKSRKSHSFSSHQKLMVMVIFNTSTNILNCQNLVWLRQEIPSFRRVAY